MLVWVWDGDGVVVLKGLLWRLRGWICLCLGFRVCPSLGVWRDEGLRRRVLGLCLCCRVRRLLSVVVCVVLEGSLHWKGWGGVMVEGLMVRVCPVCWSLGRSVCLLSPQCRRVGGPILFCLSMCRPVRGSPRTCH